MTVRDLLFWILMVAAWAVAIALLTGCEPPPVHRCGCVVATTGLAHPGGRDP